MHVTLWYIIVGGLLVVMALAATLLKRLPLTASLLYLLAGVALGPAGAGLIRLDPLRSAVLLERLTEVAVIVSLFTAGLKLRTPLSDARWWLPVRLASVSMVLTVALIAAAGVFGLGLPLGAAILLGAILAPTDPVLASDVQVEHPMDRDRLRFALTGEAGLNDGTAFPFVVLGLGLLGLGDAGGPPGLRWLAVDVLWAVAAGLGVGAACGTLVGRLVIHLRRTHREAVGLDDFLALGLLALAYGLALLAHAYGFLAVFAAGVALRRVEATSASDGGGHGAPPPDDVRAEAVAVAAAADGQDLATDPDKAPAYMAQAVLGFNQQLERMCEVTVVLLLGGMLTPAHLSREALWFVPALLLVIRPAAVWLGLLGARATGVQRGLIGWFGIRGVGSVYYLMYAVRHGLPEHLARPLVALTLITVAVSVAAHGVSVTPLMGLYGRVARRRQQARRGPGEHRPSA